MGIPEEPQTQSELYLQLLHTTLALKLFRGEPAISGFDWHFTANHSSSKHIALYPGAALHVVLPTLRPGHG
jgi:hypothetical protein